MPSSPDFISYLLEPLQRIGPVVAKPMFGAHGFFIDGLMFALVVDDCLYLKADAELADELEARGLPPFQYQRGDKHINLNYYQAPEEAVDDPHELCAWANRAFAVALYGRSWR